ncbi:MAG: hypothetical protein J6B89_01575 [Bacilli bacterium]|nr:hypothetical protein [Bacilli bacterium]
MNNNNIFDILNFKGKIISSTKNSCIIDAEDKILKIYNPQYIMYMLEQGISLEAKIKEAKNLSDIDEIVKPTGVEKMFNDFIGFSMKKIKGTLYNEIPYDKEITLEDYAILYNRFEQILKKATENNIVISDFANGSNIIFEDSDNPNIKFINKEIKIIDYDGMQIKKHRTNCMSDAILCPLIYTEKYLDNNNLFTPELNSLSLLYLYFTDVLQFKINMVGQSFYGQTLRLSDAMQLIGIDDDFIIREISKLYNPDVKNPDFSDVFYKIAEKYELIEAPEEEQEIIAVKLKKKTRL